jgi:4-amino-4-deoxychorismate lyase
LRDGCERLGIAYPGDATLEEDIRRLVAIQRDGVLKIIVTRGSGARGYRPPAATVVTRIVAIHPLPAQSGEGGLTVRWCTTRLSRNSLLAGMKHLNRLEQVLAQREWNDADIGEGLMLDTEGEVVCGTASNLFLVRNNALLTPDLRFCGVRGVMRAEVLQTASSMGIQMLEEPVWPEDLQDATEVFVTNAVRGIRSVVALEGQHWKVGPMTQRLLHALEP